MILQGAPFVDFMMKHHIMNLEEAVAEHRKSTEDDTLNLDNDTLNDTINIPSDLTEKEKAVLDAIREDVHISIAGIMDRTGFSRPTVMAHGDGVNGS